MKIVVLAAAVVAAAIAFAAPASAHDCRVVHYRSHVAPVLLCQAHGQRYTQRHHRYQAHVHPAPAVRVVTPAPLYPGPQVAYADTWSPLGLLVGAGLGALVGSQIGSGSGQIAAVGVGAFIGGLIGSDIGPR